MSKFVKIILVIFIFIITGVIVSSLRPNQLGDSIIFPVHQPQTTSIFIGGDIMLSRNVAGKMYETNNFNLPFEKIADEVNKADIAFANLESPFNDIGDHSVQNSLNFNADPKSIAGLQLAGFDILSTANNHALDQEMKGLNYTIDWLTANKILYTGSIPTKAEAVLPVIKAKNILYGFLAYSYTAHNDGGSTSPYINNFNDTAKVKQDILALKGHNADVVIVNMHAGEEYTRTPTSAQIAFAHAAIDAGADLVIGEHPHWIQTVEQYKGKWIIYSLGNLVFDQMFSTETREGLTLLVTYEKEQLKKIELKPIIIDNFCCPRWASEDETKTILQKINLTSTVLLPHN